MADREETHVLERDIEIPYAKGTKAASITVDVRGPDGMFDLEDIKLGIARALLLYNNTYDTKLTREDAFITIAWTTFSMIVEVTNRMEVNL